MPYSATVASGVFNVVLPDGNRYQAGDVVYLSDQDYAQMSNADIAAFLTGVTAFASGSAAHNDSAPDSPVSIVNSAGAAVIGGMIGTAWNKVTAAYAPAFSRNQQAECQTAYSGMIAGGALATALVDTTYTTPVTALENP